MITKQDFLTKIRSKYPTYTDVDDNTLYDSIINKYPEYKAQIETDSIGASAKAQVPIKETNNLDIVKKGFEDYTMAGQLIKGGEKLATDVIPQIGSDIATGLRNIGGDISKAQTGRQDEFKSLPGTIYNTFGKAQDSIKEAKIAEVAGEQTATTSLLQSMGFLGLATSDAIGEVFISGLNTLATDELTEDVKAGLQKAIESKGGQVVMGEVQEALDGYEHLKQTDPEKARNYKAFFGALALTADVAGFGTIGKTGVKETGKKIVKEGIEEIVTPPIKRLPDLPPTTPPSVSPKVLPKTYTDLPPVISTLTDAEKAGKFTFKESVTPTQKIVSGNDLSGIEKIKKTLQGAEDRIAQGDMEFKGVVGEEPVISKIKTPEPIKDVKPTLTEKIVGLDEKDITALEKGKYGDQFKEILTDAKKSAVDDYELSPYHKGAEKAEDAFKKLENDLTTSYTTKSQLLKDSGVKLDNTKVGEEIIEDLGNSLNVTIKQTDEGLVFGEIPGRGSSINITNKADIEVMKRLNQALDADTPQLMADRIKGLQNWIYDNSSKLVPGGVSEDMKNFATRMTGKLNNSLKEQLPVEYRNILKEMFDDIRLKEDLDRVFQVTKEGNRGELAMKRLVAGTTTTGDVKKVALAVKDRTGIDLINEARLRHLAMQIAGDTRADTLFGVIGDGPTGIIKKTLEYLGSKVGLSKESKALKRVTGENVKLIPREPKALDIKAPKGMKKQLPKKPTEPKTGTIKLGGEKQTPIKTPKKPVSKKKTEAKPKVETKKVIKTPKKEVKKPEVKKPVETKKPIPKDIEKTPNEVHSIDPKTGEGFTKDGKSLGIVDKRAGKGEIKIGDKMETDIITIEGKKFNGNSIEINGDKVGGISYDIYKNPKKTISISKIEIYPEFRGNNYAKKIIDKLFKENPTSKEISLSSAKTAESIWEKYGFTFQNHITKEGKLYKLSREDFYQKPKSPIKTPKPVKKNSNFKVAKDGTLESTGKYGNAGTIAPAQILKDIKSLAIKTPATIKKVTNSIVKELGIAKEHIKEVTKIVEKYVRKEGVKLKDKLEDLLDEISKKVGGKVEFIENSGKGLDDFGNIKSAEIGYGFTGKQVPGVKKTVLVDDIFEGSHSNTIGKENISKMKSGDYDPIVVVKEKGGYVLVDGQHRYNSLKELGIKEAKISIIKEEQVGDVLTRVRKGQQAEFTANTKAPKGLIEEARKIDYTNLADDIIKDGGITLNIKGNKNLGGKPYIAVSPYPNRSKIIKTKDFTKNDLADFIENNADKLLENKHTLGAWIDDGNVYLDVTLALDKKYKTQAIALGKKYNQKAVFDLETFDEIPTFGTGKNTLKVDEIQLLKDIKLIGN